MPSQAEIESSIVRVLNAQGVVVGTGFVVDNGLIKAQLAWTDGAIDQIVRGLSQGVREKGTRVADEKV